MGANPELKTAGWQGFQCRAFSGFIEETEVMTRDAHYHLKQ
jgi:hypothetical protein